MHGRRPDRLGQHRVHGHRALPHLVAQRVARLRRAALFAAVGRESLGQTRRRHPAVTRRLALRVVQALRVAPRPQQDGRRLPQPGPAPVCRRPRRQRQVCGGRGQARGRPQRARRHLSRRRGDLLAGLPGERDTHRARLAARPQGEPQRAARARRGTADDALCAARTRLAAHTVADRAARQLRRGTRAGIARPRRCAASMWR
mmetsp:Transcript_11981/g.31475  ORF Transcript_11981/g.31475 Transcript_11981/m.31475 type:complete len:202 (+) Transcript_11981:300-905(+)